MIFYPAFEFDDEIIAERHRSNFTQDDHIFDLSRQAIYTQFTDKHFV